MQVSREYKKLHTMNLLATNCNITEKNLFQKNKEIFFNMGLLC